ncbi:MAG: hypothetical protein ACLPX5_14955 [Dissulfurispiraceae bacterium]
MNLPDRMNYVEALGVGDPEVLCLASSRIPETRPDEVLIRVLAAGVNRPDILQRKGLYAHVWPVLSAGRRGPVIYQVLPHAKEVAAHQMMESSIHIGKIVLKVTD